MSRTNTKTKTAERPSLEGDLEPTPAQAPATRSNTGVAELPTQGQMISMLERMMVMPDLPVERVNGFVDLFERMINKQAKQEFSIAMSACQADMEPVSKDADNNHTHSRYTTYAALDRALRPIYTKHGFSLSFDTEPGPDICTVYVLCYVEHRGGHARTHRILMPADGKGARGGDVMTKTHATGSATAYGMRYLLRMIFNVATGDASDDDGNAAAATEQAAQDYAPSQPALSQMQHTALMKECALYNPPAKAHAALQSKFGVPDISMIDPKFFDGAVQWVRNAIAKQQGQQQ